MQLDIVVHGRFFAFDLARALTARGHDVRVITNYPRGIVRRFGFRTGEIRTFVLHGILARVLRTLPGWLGDPEAALHEGFGRWAARQVRRNSHAVVVFSGVALELLRMLPPGGGVRRVLVRSSVHIRESRDLRTAEASRGPGEMDGPSDWMIAREEAEYQLADKIWITSGYARDTFLRHGVRADRMALIGLGVDVRRFTASSQVIEARLQRIRSGRRLRVLTTGSFIARKGAMDLVQMARRLCEEAEFRFVGDPPPPGSALSLAAEGVIELKARVPEHALPAEYEWADLFCFPTIEDGFAVVLVQALANGLPVLTTPNCAGPDVVQEGLSGWILPIRDPESFVERIRWCNNHRQELASMVTGTDWTLPVRDWSAVGKDFEELICAIHSGT